MYYQPNIQASSLLKQIQKKCQKWGPARHGSPINENLAFTLESTAVPEPGTIALGFFGALAFLFRRRSQRTSAGLPACLAVSILEYPLNSQFL
jgi:hypothetical protein